MYAGVRAALVCTQNPRITISYIFHDALDDVPPDIDG